jgi:hypothetical protein
MAHYYARVDTTRKVEKSGSVRQVPVVVNGAAAVAAFDEEAFEALADMVSTIQRRIPDYTYMSAIERAACRAAEDGLISDGVIKVTPAHI